MFRNLVRIHGYQNNFSPSWGSYVLNQFRSILMFGMKGIYLSTSGAIQDHHGALVFFCLIFQQYMSVLNTSLISAIFLARLSTTCSGGAIVTGHRPSSVRPSVRPSICPSVNNFFKNLLLQNQKANLDKTWQECSLGEALQKLLKEFNSNKNSGCHGNKMAENGKNL